MKVWKEECRKGSAVPTDRRPLPRGLLFLFEPVFETQSTDLFGNKRKKIPVQCSRSLPTEGRTRGNALSHQREERTKPPYIPSSHFLPLHSALPNPKRTPIPYKTLRSILLSMSRNRAPSLPPRSSRIRFGTSPRTKPLCYGPLPQTAPLPFHPRKPYPHLENPSANLLVPSRKTLRTHCRTDLRQTSQNAPACASENLSASPSVHHLHCRRIGPPPQVQ